MTVMTAAIHNSTGYGLSANCNYLDSEFKVHKLAQHVLHWASKAITAMAEPSNESNKSIQCLNHEVDTCSLIK